MKNKILVEARKNRNLTQDQVAKIIGVSERYYQKLEAGNSIPNVKTAIALSEVLQVEVPELFGD